MGVGGRERVGVFLTKTTACVGEHCLQLRLGKSFQEEKKPRILYTMVVGVKKRGHILKEVRLYEAVACF